MSGISPSTSPAPTSQNGSTKPTVNVRSSLGPSSRQVSGGSPAHNLASPRPAGMIGSTRPASELLGGSVAFQTPESEALDQWFENLQSYEATLEEMAAASTDVNFKEELSAIEQWFRVLSEAERTAALYSLLQHSTQVQIRFFITVLQQMARSDPMTALLSPALGGGSMQAQMESKLASMGLGGLKSPASPSTRTFSGSAPRQSSDSPATSNNNFLSPDSANVPNEAAATLAQQRAKLKATNAQHRISAPVMLSNAEGSRSSVWASNPSQLGQVIERGSSPATSETTAPASGTRPKSTDFTGVANTFRSPRPGSEALDEQLSPMPGGGNWASMVNTPLVPMFDQNGSNSGVASLDAASAKLASWGGGANKPMVLDDVRKFRRNSAAKSGTAGSTTQSATTSQSQPGQSPAPKSNTFGAMRSASAGQSGGTNNNLLSGQAWGGSPNIGNSGARSPALSSSARFGSDDGGLSALSALPNFGMGLASPGMAGLGMGNLPGLGVGGLGMGVGGLGMGGVNAAAYQNMLNLQNFSAMAAAAGLSPDAAAAQSHYLAQLAASGGLMPGGAAGLNFAAAAAAAGAFGSPGLGGAGGRRGQGGASGSGMRSPSARGGGTGGSTTGGGNGGATKDKEEEFDPALLNDVPAWLRSLRLHKYTPNFEGMTWKEMVILDEAQLEEKGVAALGARRKMLKTFEIVKAKMGMEEKAE